MVELTSVALGNSASSEMRSLKSGSVLKIGCAATRFKYLVKASARFARNWNDPSYI